MNQETRRSEGIGARAIPGSRDTITSSETRRELTWSAPPALTRYTFGPSILTIVADKMPVACEGRTPGVVHARTRMLSPTWNRWTGVGCRCSSFTGSVVGTEEASAMASAGDIGVEMSAVAVA